MKKMYLAAINTNPAYVQATNGQYMTYYTFADEAARAAWAAVQLRSNPAASVIFAETTEVATVQAVPLTLTAVTK